MKLAVIGGSAFATTEGLGITVLKVIKAEDPPVIAGMALLVIASIVLLVDSSLDVRRNGL